MEFVMNKIMDIDKNAELYRQGIDDLLKEKQMQTEKTINDIRVKWHEEAKALKDSILNNKLKEAEERAQNIRIEKEIQLAEIKAKYESSKSKISEDIFFKIIGSS